MPAQKIRYSPRSSSPLIIDDVSNSVEGIVPLKCEPKVLAYIEITRSQLFALRGFPPRTTKAVMSDHTSNLTIRVAIWCGWSWSSGVTGMAPAESTTDGASFAAVVTSTSGRGTRFLLHSFRITSSPSPLAISVRSTAATSATAPGSPLSNADRWRVSLWPSAIAPATKSSSLIACGAYFPAGCFCPLFLLVMANSS